MMTPTAPPTATNIAAADINGLHDLRRRVLLFGAAPLGALALFFSGQGSGGPTICPYRLCTDHACPGCGITRSISTGLRGDLALSWRFHPLGLLIAFQLLVVWLVLATGWKRDTFQRLLPIVLTLNAVLLVGTWALRWKLGLLDFVLAD